MTSVAPLRFLLPLLLGSLALAGGPQVPQQPPTFGSTVSITRVKVAVLDGSGRAVTGLSAGDFHVQDQGVEQEVRLVLDPEQAPLDVAVLLDYSTSVAETWRDARERARGFLAALSPRDCVYVLPFNSRVGPGVRASPAAPELGILVDRFPMIGRTLLYDAMVAGYEALDNPAVAARGWGGSAPLAATLPGACGTGGEIVERRPAMVVLTDGADSGSNFSYSDVLLDAWRAGVPVFPVAVGSAALSRRDLDGYRSLGFSRADITELETVRDQLAELARVSGGRMVTQREIRDGYDEVLALLRGYYVVGYRTPEPRQHGWHDVEVTVPGTSHRVIVQPGYYSTEIDEEPAIRSLDLGRALLGARRFDEALAWFDTAAGLAPGVGFPWLGQALAHEALGQWREARDAYEESLRWHPGHAATHLRLARLYQRLHDDGLALDHALRAQLGGADAGELVSALRGTVAPSGIEPLLRRPVLFVVRPEAPSLEAQLALLEVIRLLGVQLDRSADVVLTMQGGGASHYVRLDVERLQGSPPRELRFRLELYDLDGDWIWDQRLDLRDLADAAEVLRALERPARDLAQRAAR